MIECDSLFVAFVVRCKFNRFAVKENDITNTLGLRAYYQNQYNTVFQDCYVAPTEFSPIELPRPSLHRPSLPAPAVKCLSVHGYAFSSCFI